MENNLKNRILERLFENNIMTQLEINMIQEVEVAKNWRLDRTLTELKKSNS